MIDMLYDVLLLVYFLVYTFTFSCSLYIAIHNKNIPNWIITPLWYIGLSSAFTGITILLEWIYGDQFCMGYSKIGFIGELAFAASVGATLGILFANTLREHQAKVKN